LVREGRALEPGLEHELLTIPEAARRAGISEVALRQRIKRRTQRSARKGGHLWVAAADVPAAVETVGTVGTLPVGTVSTAVALVETVPTVDVTVLLREQIDGRLRAEQAAAMWQERARNLEAENGRLQELLALPAHEDAFEPSRRWWQWWRRKEQHAGA